MPEVLECHHITGVDSFIMKAAVRSKEHLADIICSLSSFGQTTTSLVLSTPVSKRVLEQKPELNGGGHVNVARAHANGARANSNGARAKAG